MGTPERRRVVIVGGGFGGLEVAKALASVDVEVLLVDRTNHHLFQPLLYQVAMAGLSPAEIASPLRSILRKQRNVSVMLEEGKSIDLDARLVRMREAKFTMISSCCQRASRTVILAGMNGP